MSKYLNKPIKYDLIKRFKGRGDEFEHFCFDILSHEFDSFIRKSEVGYDFGIDLRVENKTTLEILRKIKTSKDSRYLVDKTARIIVQCKASGSYINLKQVADSICYADLQLPSHYILMTNNTLANPLQQWIHLSNLIGRRGFDISFYDTHRFLDILNQSQYFDVAKIFFPKLKSQIHEREEFLKNYSTDRTLVKNGVGFILNSSNPEESIDQRDFKSKDFLHLFARIDYPYNAGTSNCLRVFVDNEELTQSDLVNKGGDYEFSSGRTFPWVENGSFTLFYSPNFNSNYSDKKYSLKTAGDPYLYIFKLPKSYKKITFKHTLSITPSIVGEILLL